jgi:3-oxoacyl-(acyl-carrier-protein) synthase/NAD(P)-dependent dehydrogenase (short-subunit alcohol dehydrogenase family)
LKDHLRKVQQELSQVIPQVPTQESQPVRANASRLNKAEAHIDPEPSPFEPIAIVGLGCVLPGAADGPGRLWQNISTGVNGIVDLTKHDAHAREDFLAGSVDGESAEIVSDKTYTLLNGSILNVVYDGRLLEGRYTEPEFGQLTKGQKILALSLAQARLSKAGEVIPSKIQCILGSTADGSAELDEAHFAASIRERLGDLDAPSQAKNDFSKVLASGLPGWNTNPDDLTPHKLYARVAERILGVTQERCYLVDSACSSSLYSLALGARALRTREADLVYAGGVFAPGPANNNLFAQFRGLTPNESRPFDAKADGVVFGDGAGILTLKRLSDAIDDGDAIHGVIRSEGFSSDGKSPSINVPQSNGQVMALRAAYSRAAIDPRSVQYIEAHATATPVGDAVEFRALQEALPPADGWLRPLGSVKALIGHTGWTSGVASVIKICKAMEHRRIPKQFAYESPNPNIELNGSGFVVPSEEIDWPQNAGGLPRRAGINGFGFGGTNAHFVVEEYLDPYHRALAARFRGRSAAQPEVVIVAAETVVPEGGRGFERRTLRMPKKRLVLPDVAEHMDASQYLAAMAAEKIAESLPPGVLKSDLRIGVTLGLESKTERGVRANERVFLDRLSRVARSGGASDEVLRLIRKTVTEKVIASGPYTLPGLMPNVAASRITHTFNWHGPNIVIDRGTGSFAQALDAGIKLIQAGDCELVLAGAINAWTGHQKGSREAATLLGLASAETAQKNGLPVLARIRTEGAPGATQVALDSADSSYRGATGALDVLNAIRELASKPAAFTLTWNCTPLFTLVPASGVPSPARAPKEEMPVETHGSHAYVQGTPITNYTQVLVDAEPIQPRRSSTPRSFLFLTDQPEEWRRWERELSRRHISYSVCTPAGSGVTGAHEIDVSSEEKLAQGLCQLKAMAADTVVAIKELSKFSERDFLLKDFKATRGLVDLLFGVTKHRYEDIAQKRCSVATVCLGAMSTGGLDGFTGLFAGFVKSLSRELPEARCKAIAIDRSAIVDGLAQVSSELDSNDGIVEVAYREGQRLRPVLTESEPLHCDGTPWVSPGAVVLATGGGRGVTAVLAQHLIEAHGCTVIALGRTDPKGLPERLARLDEAAFKAYEPEFYREELARDRSKRIPDLKRLFEAYQAAHELVSVIRSFEHLRGKFEYIQCDINDQASIELAFDDVIARHGRLDMVMHGAGVQVSKVIPRKTLADYQRVVTTKLGSLGHLYRACHKRGLDGKVHFHILTSAFSYLGNDGQPDYGGANEAMNRIASRLNLTHPGCYWSSLAWLGWAGIGMTRGTEYAALAASRRLRGVTREEGQQIFADAMAGPPAAPINILLAAGEVAFYKPEIRKRAKTAAPARPAQPQPEGVVEWPISPEAMPFLSDHVVRGVPTLPGSFIIAMAADAARKLRPDLKVVQFERTRFLRMVKAYSDRPSRARATAKVVEKDGSETVVLVHILMDFVHKSGRVLAENQLHTEIYVRMAADVRQPSDIIVDSQGTPGMRLPDPYVMGGSPVQLDGAFRTMSEVLVGRETRSAGYKLNGGSRYGSDFDYMIPNIILVDAFWRFGTVRTNESGGYPVYVPERCDAMKVFFDYADFGAERLRDSVTFHGANPIPEGDVLHVGPLEAVDSKGRMLLRLEGGLCRKFGQIEVQ